VRSCPIFSRIQGKPRTHYDPQGIFPVRRRTRGGDGGPQIHRPARHLAALLVSRRHLGRRHLRGRRRLRRLVDPGVAGHQRLGHAGRPGPLDDLPRPVLRPAHRQCHRGHQGSRDARRLHARPPARSAQGDGIHQADGHRRRVLRRTGAGILHLRRGALRPDAAPGLLRDRLGGRRLEHGAVRGAEPGLQAELQGRLLSRQPDRHVPRPARRDGLPDARAGHRRRGASPRGGHRRAGRDRHAVRRAAGDGRPVHVVQVHHQERRQAAWQDGHVHAQADLRGQRQRHAHAHVAVEGRAAALRGRRLRGVERGSAPRHRGPAEARQGGAGLRRADGQLVPPARTRLRGPRQPGHEQAQPLGVGSHPDVFGQSEGQAAGVPLPRSELQRLPDVLGDADGAHRRHPEPDRSRPAARPRHL